MKVGAIQETASEFLCFIKFWF